ncbi:hypothetical protein GCM10022251_33220 [Phytohabitans flavus]
MAAGLAASLLAAPASPAAAAAPINKGVYQLELRAPGTEALNYAIDVPEGSTAPVEQPILFPRHGGENQQFELRDAGGGYYKIITQHTLVQNGEAGKLCLDVRGAYGHAGAAVIQYHCIAADNQAWRIAPLGNGYYSIQAKHSGMYLSYDLGHGVIPWARMVQETNPVAWQLTPSSYRIKSGSTTVVSGWPSTLYVGPCASGWHYRWEDEFRHRVSYENAGDSRWSNDSDAHTSNYAADNGSHVRFELWWYALVIGDPYSITAQVRIFCDPN